MGATMPRLAAFAAVLALLWSGAAAQTATDRASPGGQAPAQGAAQQAGNLVTGLSTNRIAITSSFTGTEIVLFGAVEGLQAPRDYDVVVVIEGPRRETVVRRKDRVMGIWLNAEGVELSDAPASLYILTSGPLIASAPAIIQEGLSLEARLPQAGLVRGGEIFRQALIRLKTERALYGVATGGVEFLSDILFRASVTVPASIPVGLHTAEIHLLRGGAVIASQQLPILIEKQGLEEAAYTLATSYSLFYGILAVAIAFFMGWAASVIFRKE